MMKNEIQFKATKVFQEIWKASQSKKYKLIVEEGSSRSSKTWSNFQVLFLDLYENPLTTCTILRDTQKSCREIVEVDFVKWLSDPMGRKKQLENKLIDIKQFDKLIKEENLTKYFLRNKTNHTWTFKHNDSFIRFTGLDDEDDAMGMTQDICWINEPYKFSHEVYKQLSQRTAKYMLFDWNPKQSHWVNDEKKKSNTITLYSTFMDNPFCPIESRKQIQSYQPLSYCDVVVSKLIDLQSCLTYNIQENGLNFSKKQINELVRCLYNEEVNSSSEYHWLVFGLGLKAEKPNRVFKWNEILYKEYLNIDSRILYGVDWGTVDPFGIIEAKYNDGCLYLHELNYMSENEWRNKLTQTEHLQIKGSQEGFVTWLFTKLNVEKDKDIICDNNRPLKILALRNVGYDYARATHKYQGSIHDGVDLLQNLKVCYTSTSENIRYEQENYSHKTDRSGVIVDDYDDKDNHIIDPARYIALYLQEIGVIKIV